MSAIHSKRRRPRRATVLLMVVALLALLFVLVTGFLSLARVDRQTVEDLEQADVTDAIVADIADLALEQIRSQLVGEDGRVLGGGSAEKQSQEDIPGYRWSRWLAPLEPVWDAGWAGSVFGWSGAWTVLEQLLWPAVTSLDDSVDEPQAFRLYELMRDYYYDDYNPTAPTFRIQDVEWNGRNPFMDADADGVPDAHLLLTRRATELANGALGRALSLPAYDPDPLHWNRFRTYQIPLAADSSLNNERWQRYDQQARYEAAVRIISHGGMVALQSPTLRAPNGAALTPFNRDFITELFDSVIYWRERNRLSALPDAEKDRIFDALATATERIESLLRRRFLLPGAHDSDGLRPVPPILSELYGELGGNTGFPQTFATLPVPGGQGNFQRINLADSSAVRNWAQQVSFDATRYNRVASPNDTFLSSYVRRHLITTVSHSDELARKQAAAEPDPAAPQADRRLGTYQGELKFYLGEVSKAFVEVGAGQYAYDYRRGSVIVERLARLFYDMLSPYEGFADPGSAGVFDADAINEADPEEVLTRRQQAFMLAVNVLGFATPRDTNAATRGFIDVVSCVDAPGGVGSTGTEYVGYAPQPFFSEVIAYNESDPDDPPGQERDHVAIAVELYNPNDPLPGFDPDNPDSDPFALHLAQFAIAVGGVNPNDTAPGTTWAALNQPAWPTRLPGRSFLTFAIVDAPDGTDHFNSYVQNRSIPLAVADPVGSDSRVKLDLWRWGRYYDSMTGTAQGRWFHVDRIEVLYPDRGDWASRYRDLARSTVDPAQWGQAYPYFGVVQDAQGGPHWSRWSVVCAWDDDETIEPPGGTPDPDNEATGSEPGGPGADALHDALGAVGQGSPVQFLVNATGGNSEATQATLPVVPLLTMNAGPHGPSGTLYERLNSLPMFGNSEDLRPRSFPTAGFLLFVPRYSHVHQVSAVDFPGQSGILATRTMSQTLEKERYRRNYDGNRPWTVPADFGHMPVFDNRQDVDDDSYFHDTKGVGKVPWGLLVFDYFTTLDPARDANGDGQPDVDPLRVPGRININTAPWYVLANLPLLGPRSPDGTDVLPIIPPGSITSAFPSPSFWHPDVGVLVGWGGWDGNTSTISRLLATEGYANPGFAMPWADDPDRGLYRLGPWLAQSAAAYRDGVQYLEFDPSRNWCVYADSQVRGGQSSYYHDAAGGRIPAMPYRDNRYGTRGGVRGAAKVGEGRPTQYGFTTVGELLNVKGFDSSRHDELPPWQGASAATTTLGRGDFVKAVSLLALLDTQYLTTRSNTFTIYTSLMDREDPQRSIRSQITVDRSNLLPRLSYAFYDPATRRRYPLSQVDLSDPANAGIIQLPLVPMLLDLNGDGVPESPVRQTNDDARPQVLARETVGYFNTRYDD